MVGQERQTYIIKHGAHMKLEENGVSASAGLTAQGTWLLVYKIEDS